MKKIYDVAIVGSGPAAIEAAINLQIRKKSFIIFGNDFLSNKLIKAPKIDNYLGYYGIKGEELKEKFVKHLNYMNINIIKERVNNVYDMGSYFALMVNSTIYQAKSVIIGTGVEFSKPIMGEDSYLGRGVGYCATCDAPLYKGRIVAVVGYNKEAENEMKYVSEIVKKLYYIPLYKSNVDFTEDNIEVIHDVPMEVEGDIEVKRLIMKKSQVDINGVFFLRDSVSPGQLVPGIGIDNGHIIVNRKMETNIKGLYAVGDCTGKPYQYMKACGEGQIAALNIVEYLDSAII